jgi:hypothetical protein
MKRTKKKTTKRRETPATKRLKLEKAALQASVAELSLSLTKERRKSECFHDPQHRYTVPRTVLGGGVVKVAICGYCGRELSTEHLDDVAIARKLLNDHKARHDMPRSGGARLLADRYRMPAADDIDWRTL